MSTVADRMVSGKAAAISSGYQLLNQLLTLSFAPPGSPGAGGTAQASDEVMQNMISQFAQAGAWGDASLKNLKGSAFLRANLGQTGAGLSTSGSGGTSSGSARVIRAPPSRLPTEAATRPPEAAAARTY